MINFNSLNTNVADNLVVINNQLRYNLTDEQVQQVVSILNGLTSGTPLKASKPSTKLSLPEEKWEKAPMKGSKMFQSDFVTVTEVDTEKEGKKKKEYRVYLDCPIAGEKGEKIRHALKRQIKQDFGGGFGGNYNLHDIYWTLPSQAKAKAYIEARKAYDAKYEQEKKEA